MGIIFYLSSLPGDLLEKEFGLGIDQSIKHFVEFTILGILMANIFWQFSRRTAFHRYLVAFSSSSAFSTFYGVLDEFHQYFVPTRYCTVFDMLVNIVGSIAGVLIFLLYVRMIGKDGRII